MLYNQTQFALLAGVKPPTIHALKKGRLAAAVRGRKIDATHPAAVEYLQSRGVSPPGVGLPPITDENAQKPTKTTRKKAKNAPKTLDAIINVAQNLNENLEEMGATVHSSQITTRSNPDDVKSNRRRKARAKAEGIEDAGDPFAIAAMPSKPGGGMNVDGMEKVLELTLYEIVAKHGTVSEFLDWVKSVKAIEDIIEKRLKNAEKAGTLISKALVEKAVIGTLDGAFTRMLTDGSKTIATRAAAMAKAGSDIIEIEAMTSKQLSTFIKPTKAKMARVLGDV